MNSLLNQLHAKTEREIKRLGITFPNIYEIYLRKPAFVISEIMESLINSKLPKTDYRTLGPFVSVITGIYPDEKIKDPKIRSFVEELIDDSRDFGVNEIDNMISRYDEVYSPNSYL